MISVVLADDQAVVRAGFRTILTAEPDITVAGEASDGAQAVRLARRLRPDLVLMDIRMPGMDGIAATERLAGGGVPDLVAAVRTVAGGQGLVAPQVTRRLIAEFARTARPAADPAADRLTDRERETLVLVARGLSNSEIAEHMMVGAATVKSHVASLLAKLGCRDRVRAVIHAYEHGVVLPGR